VALPMASQPGAKAMGAVAPEVVIG